MVRIECHQPWVGIIAPRVRKQGFAYAGAWQGRPAKYSTAALPAG